MKATCSKEFTLTSIAATDCASIGGRKDLVWSYSQRIIDNYGTVPITRVWFNDNDYYGDSLVFSGYKDAYMALSMDSDDFGLQPTYSMYIADLTIDSVNIVTGEVVFTGTPDWPVNAFALAPCKLLPLDGINAGDDSIIQSNTANSITVQLVDIASFSAGGKCAVIVVEEANYGLWGSRYKLPATATYTLEFGVSLIVGIENEPWWYDVTCLWASYINTVRTASPILRGFIPFGETDSGTTVRYLKQSSEVTSNSTINVWTSNVITYTDTGTGYVTGFETLNANSGLSETYIQEGLSIPSIPYSMGPQNLSARDADNRPVVPYGTNNLGYGSGPGCDWSNASATEANAGNAYLLYGDKATDAVEWYNNFSGSATFSEPYDPGTVVDTYYVESSTGDTFGDGAWLRDYIWVPPTGLPGYWWYTYRGLAAVSIWAWGLIAGRSYKVTAQLQNISTLAIVQDFENTFVAVASSKEVPTTIQMLGADMIQGEEFELLAPTILDVTP